MRTGIIAKKIGITSLYNEDGSRSPATILFVDSCEVTDVKTIEKNKYLAVQIGIEDKNSKKIKKPQKNSLTKIKSSPKKYLKEFRVSKENLLDIGTKIGVNHFEIGQFIDVTSISKGKGFAGSMKRHNFSGGRASHGASVSHRAHGSTGNSQDPGRVFKGKKMAGHMGNNKVTIQNLKVLEVDEKNNIILIKGSVPGSNNSIVSIKDSIKKKKLKKS